MSLLVRVLFFLPALILAQTSCRADDFYKGRTITFSTFATPGGSYDTYLRLLTQYIGKYIPGDPAMVVLNQPGAGGLVAANYAGKSAPQDGTFATLMGVGVIIQGALSAPNLRTPLQDFNWLGNFTKDNNIVVTSETSSAKTLEDAKAREVTLGSLGAGSIDAQLPALYNQLLGTKFKIIYGYEGTPQVLTAMERGEVEGQSNIWPTFKAVMPNGGAQRLHVLLQIGLTKDPELPNVPLLTDLVKGDSGKEAITRFMTLAAMISRPLAAPPNVPADRVQSLRRAFDVTLKDPDFLAQARKAGFNINPMTGEEVQKAIQELMSSPKETIAAAKRMLEKQPN
jgi:tripartite-type tricarboxylate transporter receptor subunit TctC